MSLDGSVQIRSLAITIPFPSSIQQSVISPLPHFYLLMKVHKTPLKTRPIVSYTGSLLYGLGKWVDHHLQSVSRTFRSFIKSSFDLKHELDQLTIPAGCRLLTADATAMYTNINSSAAIGCIHRYMLDNSNLFPLVPIDAVVSALHLIMDNNIFQFGDTFWKQLTGTAMGAPPAPPYATAAFGTHEETLLNEFPSNLLYYRRYIDDVFAIWIPDPDPIIDCQLLLSFSQRLNDWHGLKWIVSPLSTSVVFLDLTLTIVDDHIVSSLYKKPMNLHLYIPPRWAHPPGVLLGLISGWIYCLLSLCSLLSDAHDNICSLWTFLLAQGYQPSKLRPIFDHAIQTVRPFDPDRTTTPVDPDHERLWLFKLQYHPQDPPPSQLQQLWSSCIANPPLPKPLADVDINYEPIGHRRFIVCYKRAPNLGNLLSYRKLRSDTGPPASSYLHLIRDS